jgi:hypothetical protein
VENGFRDNHSLFEYFIRTPQFATTRCQKKRSDRSERASSGRQTDLHRSLNVCVILEKRIPAVAAAVPWLAVSI